MASQKRVSAADESKKANKYFLMYHFVKLKKKRTRGKTKKVAANLHSPVIMVTKKPPYTAPKITSTARKRSPE